MRAATVVQVLQDFEAPPTIAPRPPTTVANPHIDPSLGSKKTHIQSHNRREGAVVYYRIGGFGSRNAGVVSKPEENRDAPNSTVSHSAAGTGPCRL